MISGKQGSEPIFGTQRLNFTNISLIMHYAWRANLPETSTANQRQKRGLNFQACLNNSHHYQHDEEEEEEEGDFEILNYCNL